MNQSEFDKRIQQENRKPAVDDDINAERRLLGYRLRSILKPVGREVKNCKFYATNNMTLHNKDRNSTNNHPENLQILCDLSHKNVHDIAPRNEHD